MRGTKLAAALVLAVALLATPATGALAGASPAGGAFPATIHAANGPVALAAKPVRIVSLSPTATEDLFAVGAGPQVVAVDDQSDYPPSAPKTKLSGYTPNAEAIAGYRPDLVVISNDTGGLVKALGKLKIPVLLEPAAGKLADAYAQIDQLGAATGHGAAAARLVAGLRRQVASIRGSLPAGAKGLTVYHELEPDYYSVTSATFIGQIYKLLGLKDIADAAKGAGSGYPKLSAEYIVATSPDLIVLADSVCCGQTPAKVEARPGWGTIAAVKRHDVVAVNDDVASRWGPRIVAFMREVADAARAAAR
jgi:iron complex transport system substrate-binding protein